MLTVKTDGRLVVGMEQIVGIDCCVGITEEAPHALLVLVVESLKTVLGHLFIGLYQSLGHDEVLYAVMCLHRFTHLQGGVHDDAVEAAQHLCIHAAHRGADDEVGLLAVAYLS